MPANRNEPRAVLLDLDGTLLDTAPDLIDAVNRLRAEHELPPLPLATLRPLCSWGARGMLRGGLNVTPDDPEYETLRDRFIALYRTRLAVGTTPFPGMREALRVLGEQGWDWGVVTNKFEALAQPLMDAMAFRPAPLCVIGGDSAAHPKPHPAPLHMAREVARLHDGDCIYVGDSQRDIAAGRAAGMATIAAAYGYVEDGDLVADWGADIIIQHAAELPAAVRRLGDERVAG